jgi:hypothetical protein
MNQRISWDPDRPETRPRWRASQVAHVLHGIDWTRDETRFARGSISRLNHSIQTLVFACGCVVADDNGWQPCGHGLHPVLADRAPGGRTIVTFLSLRAAFDAVLAQAWLRRGHAADNYMAFYVARQRQFVLAFETWQQTHDLLGQGIWKDGDLRADLEGNPLGESIQLYNGGNHDRPDIMLEFHSEHRGYVRVPAAVSEALATVFPNA